MKLYVRLSAWLLFLTCGCFILPSFAICADVTSGGSYTPPPPLLSWTFTKANGVNGWQAGESSGIADFKAGDNHLQGRTILTGASLTSPEFNLQPSPQRVVDVRLRVDHDTALEVRGITQVGGKATVNGGSLPSLTVTVSKNRRFHTFRIAPFWQGTGPLKRLQLAFSQPARFDIESIQVLDLSQQPEPGTVEPLEDVSPNPGAKPWTPEPPSPLPGPLWNFAKNAEGWNAASRVDDLRQWLGVLRLQTDREVEGLLLSPPIHLSTGSLNWLALRIKTDLNPKEHKSIRFLWTENDPPGLQSVEIPLKAGERFHVYHVNLAQQPGWTSGPVNAIGLAFPPRLLAQVDYVRLTENVLPEDDTDVDSSKKEPDDLDIPLKKENSRRPDNHISDGSGSPVSF
jgi:hypothetical protein